VTGGLKMKIRKTILSDAELNIFIYENKKDEYFVVAVPTLEWSTKFTYDDFGEELLNQIIHSLSSKLDEQEAITLGHRINQWTREM
jgi:hypothetical protein